MNKGLYILCMLLCLLHTHKADAKNVYDDCQEYYRVLFEGSDLFSLMNSGSDDLMAYMIQKVLDESHENVIIVFSFNGREFRKYSDSGAYYTRKYAIGYPSGRSVGNSTVWRSCWMAQVKKNRNCSFLRIYYSDTVFDMQTALTMVYIGLHNKKEIMYGQQAIVNVQNDTTFTADEPSIANMLKVHKHALDRLFQEPIYEIPFKTYIFNRCDSCTQRFNYYYQNCEFHFYWSKNSLPNFPRFSPRYNTSRFTSIMESYNSKMEHQGKGKDILSVTHINRILPFGKETLVFNTDSTFYHLSYDSLAVSGPFTISCANKFRHGSLYIGQINIKDSTITLRYSGFHQKLHDEIEFDVFYNKYTHAVNIDTSISTLLFRGRERQFEAEKKQHIEDSIWMANDIRQYDTAARWEETRYAVLLFLSGIFGNALLLILAARKRVHA